MQRLRVSRVVWGVLVAAGYALAFSTIWADAEHQPQAVKESVHMTMEALHAAGGVPPGWQFTLPAGDPAAGREVFIARQCYTCHNVAGEQFPAYPARDVGPDLTGMGAHHPAAYFAEAIINPNAVIVTGEGYSGPDGLSRMPEYNDTLTITQLIDLVTYLKSLQGPASHAHPGTMGQTPQPATGHQHGHGGHTPPPVK